MFLNLQSNAFILFQISKNLFQKNLLFSNSGNQEIGKNEKTKKNPN